MVAAEARPGETGEVLGTLRRGCAKVSEMRESCAVIALRVLAIVIGSVAVLGTVLAAIKTVVLPRAVVSYVTRAVFLSIRKVLGVIASPKRSFAFRDRVLAYYAPFSLVVLPGVWVAIMIAGFTGIQWGIGGLSLREAFLASGSSILTLGVLFHKPLPHAFVSFFEATIGLGLIGLMISYLPSIYGAFGRREQLVGMLEVRAGLPPSPAELLVRYHRIGWLTKINEELFAKWEEWFVDVEESHTSVPALAFFRSPHPERNWVTAAGVVLDTAAIVWSVVDQPQSPQAAVMLRTGAFSLRRIASFFNIPFDYDPKADDPISVSRREFDLLCVELQAAGIPLRANRDKAFADFSGWRVNYDAVLVGLAARVVAPPARWSSDRPQ
jgi:hypothetical protein